MILFLTHIIWRSFRVKFRLRYLLIFALLLIASAFLPPQTALAVDTYTVNSTLRHNPGVTGAQLDSFIRNTCPLSPLVGLGQTWVDTGEKYNIDPVFLMSHAILESGWGFSWISLNKKNIYGWGAYDRDPEGMAMTFLSYESGIDYVVTHIDSMYLTPDGDYYTPFGPTLHGMNVHYATSQTWADNITSIMNDFASHIPNYQYPPLFREYDALYTKIDAPTIMQPAMTYQLTVKVDNNGVATWPKDGPFKLTYRLLNEQGSDVGAGEAPVSYDVKPGSSVFMHFPVTSPATPENYTLRLDMLEEGVTTFSSKNVSTLDIPINVVPESPYYKVSYVSKSTVPATAYAGSIYPISTDISNVSSALWPATVTKFGYQWIDAQTSNIVASNVAEAGLDKSLFPSQTSTVNLDIHIPSQAGYYILKQDLVDSQSIWFSSKGAPAASNLVQVMPDFGATYKLISPTGPLYASTPKMVNINIVNTSKMTWTEDGPVKLSYSFTDSGGHQDYKARIPMLQDVSPGENVTIAATIVPPPIAGSYQLSFNLIYESQSWFSEQGVAPFSVPVSVSYDLNASYADIDLRSLFTGTTTEAKIALTNISSMTWPANGPVKLSYSFDDTGAHQGYVARIPMPKDVQPGQTVTLTVPITGPTTLGTYRLTFDLIDERVGWFSQQGVTLPSRAVLVLPSYQASYEWISVFPHMRAGTTQTILVSITNTGNVTWPAGGNVRLSYSYTDNGAHQGYEARIMMPETVAPGKTVDLIVPLTIPSTPGSYTLKFDLIAEGFAWFSEQGSPVTSVDVEVEN